MLNFFSEVTPAFSQPGLRVNTGSLFHSLWVRNPYNRTDGSIPERSAGSGHGVQGADPVSRGFGENRPEDQAAGLHRHEGLTLVWEDNGVGVTASEKERIFKRESGKNTGLGLFLVRETLSLTGMTIRKTGTEGSRRKIRDPGVKGAYRSSTP
jgi:hypothetical protein